MSTRYLIAAAFLFGSACGAQADVLPATTSTAQSGFLSSWTTGNGTDVASTGVLGNGTTLVGGGSAGVAQALYQKASANVGATDGKINLSMAEGLNGTYVVKTGNKALAALYGNGVQVMTTAEGTIITDGKSTGSVGGSSSGSTSSGTSGGSQANTGTSTTTKPVASAPTTTTKPSTSTSTTTKPADSTGSDSTVSPALNNGSTDVALGGAVPQLPSEISGNADIGQGLPTAGPAAVNGEVPEPSSIALLMAGMMGALALTRRRAR